jgi:hypothetical protein
VHLPHRFDPVTLLSPETIAVAAAMTGYAPIPEPEASQAFPLEEIPSRLRPRPATAADVAAGDAPAVGWPLVAWSGANYPVPTLEELELWSLDSVAESPDGDDVEPDAPESWLSLLGLI